MIVTNNWSSPLTACNDCSIHEGYIFLDWSKSTFTHTAATIVKLVNNATNVTRTSTIQAAEYVLPSTVPRLGHMYPVSGLTLTTQLGGINYTLYANSFETTRLRYNFCVLEHIQLRMEAAVRWFVRQRSPSRMGLASSNVCRPRIISHGYFSSQYINRSMTRMLPSRD